MMVSIDAVSVSLLVSVPNVTVDPEKVVPFENERDPLYAVTVPERNWRFGLIVSV